MIGRFKGCLGMTVLVTELCVLRTFGGVDFSLVFICVQSVSEFLWDGLHASIEFLVMPNHAQYARFGGEYGNTNNTSSLYYTILYSLEVEYTSRSLQGR